MTDAQSRGAPAPDSHPGGPARRNPWWIPPFLGRVPDLPEPQIRTLGVVALAVFFESYDQSMLSAALKQIAEGLDVSESELGSLLARVRLGALPAFLLIPLGDWIGRRRLFLASLIGLSLATVGSAFAQSIPQFILAQMASRTFMVTCSAMAYVIITEELSPQHRGWGIGILGALGAFGYGAGLILFSAIDLLPYGWRAMYLVGATPLLMLPWFRRRVIETVRFRAHLRDRGAPSGPERPIRRRVRSWGEPLLMLVRTHPLRVLGVGLIGSLSSAGHAAGFSFAAYYIQVEHGWAPGQYTLMAMLGGIVGIIGHPFAGRFADRRGRRPVGFTMFVAYPLFAVAFYHSGGWALPLLWVPLIFSLTGGITIARALSTELFPTSHRGTAAGWLSLVDALGAAAGLSIVAWGTASGESNIPMISWVVLATLGAGLVMLLVPETGRRELEDISGEPAWRS